MTQELSDLRVSIVEGRYDDAVRLLLAAEQIAIIDNLEEQC